ncbi:DUF6907 domain-containing protein [Streptomyces sp. NPDC060064]|uniref:DUF6907 domain-containing protein n=1 Tax=Streptomyces sp. NPDC060064 TaxID=3347049 RepID=UPI003696FA62
MKTVTINTRDHGPVTIPEPSWCTGGFHQPGGARADITHTSDDIPFNVETSDGPVTAMRAAFVRRPFAGTDPDRGVYVAVELDGEWHPSDPRQLDRIAAALVIHSVHLRTLARQLATMQHAERGE